MPALNAAAAEGLADVRDLGGSRRRPETSTVPLTRK
jgi:hypothetical protein